MKTKKVMAVALCVIIMLPSVSFADAMGSSVSTSAGDIAVDGTTQTGVDRAQNGVPVVNIAPPSGSGVSHNRFSDFNVGSEGAIMNNSSKMDVSQLGGALYGNPNMSPGSEGARVILNEVTSTRASRLLGATEIHGRSADYILANPNGIACNGCGFINTPRVLLGTGRPVMSNGEFLGLNVDPVGQVAVEGLGLNAGSADYFDIVTRMARINADVHAKNLGIKTGNGFYDDRTKEISSSISPAPDAPILSVDSSLLGGIYAGRITIESTELGVGVNTGGNIVSRQDMTITADGRIEYAGAVSQEGSIQMESRNSGIHQDGFAAAQGDIRLTARDAIRLEGGSELLDGYGAYSGGDVTIRSWGGTNSGIENNSNLFSLGNTSFETDGNLRNRAFVQSAQDIDASAQNLNLEDGSLDAAHELNLLGSQSIINRASLVSGRDMAVTAGSMTNDGQIISAGRADIDATSDFSNGATGEIGAQADLEIRAGGWASNFNLLKSNDTLNLTAGQDADLGGEISAGGDLNITSQHGSINSAGSILSGGSLNLSAGADLAFSDGEVLSNGDMNLNALGSLHNNGMIETAGNAVIAADIFANGLNGRIYSGEDTNIVISGDADFNGGEVISQGNLSVASLGGISSNGSLAAFSNMDIQAAEDIDLHGGDALSRGTLNITSSNGGIANSAVIQSGGRAVMTAQNDIINNGSVVAGNAGQPADIQIQGETLLNGPDGIIYTYGNAGISVRNNVTLTGGEAVACGDFLVSAGGSFANASVFQAGNLAIFQAGSDFINSGTLFSGVGTTIRANSFENSGTGRLLTSGDIDADIGGDVLISGGEAVAEGSVNITARNNFTNQADVQAGSELNIYVRNALTNQGSLLAGSAGGNANPSLFLSAGDFFNSGQGSVLSYGNATIESTRDSNIMSGQIIASNNLTITSYRDLFNGAVLHADNLLNISVSNNFSNQGTLTGGSAGRAGDATTGISITADSFGDDGSATLFSYGRLGLNSRQDLNLLGSLNSLGNMTLVSDASIMNNTNLQSDGVLSLMAGSQISNNGTITGGTEGNNASGIILSSSRLSNAGRLLSYGNTQMNISQDLDLMGSLMTYGDLTVNGSGNITNRTTVNTGGQTSIWAGGNFHNGYLDGANSVLHDIISNGDVSITAQNITNYGAIETGGNLTFSANDLFLNERRTSAQGFAGNALLTSLGNTLIMADRIVNAAGEILSQGSINLQRDTMGSRNSSVDNLSNIVGSNFSLAVIEADQDVNIRSQLLTNRSYDHGHYWVDDNVRVGDPGDEVLSLVYEDQAHSALESEPAYITAGRDMNIEGEVLNHASSLSAGRDLTINGGRVNNEDYMTDVGGLERIYMNRHFVGNGLHVIYSHTDYYGVNLVSDYRPNIYAARNLTVDSAGDITNGTPAVRNLKPIGSADLDAVRQTGVIPTIGIDLEGIEISETLEDAPALELPDVPQTGVIAFNPVPRVNPLLSDGPLFNLSALFGWSRNPQSRYLIESRGQFTSVAGLKGSEYFLERIGYNPNTDVKLLGDEYFQAKLIERSIREATGRNSLANDVSGSLEQLALLYSNAYDEGQDWHLSPGIALSQEQINDLKKDIVWLVETEIVINGKTQKVLVPQVYLARATRESLENPEALIHGSVVAIKSKGSIDNFGTLSAATSLRLEASKNIQNLQSRIVSDGDMTLLAGGDILNKAGEILAKKDMLLEAKGSITSSNLKVRDGIDKNWKDRIAAYGSIESGGSAILSAGKDVNILGSRLSAGADLGLTAGENVNILADRLDSYFHALKSLDDGAHEHAEGSTRHNLASVQSGGSMEVSAGKNIGIIGGNVAAGGSMAMDAKENVTLASVKDTDFSWTRTMTESNTGRQENFKSESRARQTSSDLSAGGDFASRSGEDTSIIASNVTAQGDGQISAGGDLNVLSAIESDSSQSYSKKTRKTDLSALQESHSYGDSQTRQKGSNLSFGGGAELVSGKDILVSASNLQAGGDMVIDAQGEASIISAAESQNHSEAHSKTKFEGIDVKFNRSSVDLNATFVSR